jgi:predicted transcriptional regulator with HTH domain
LQEPDARQKVWFDQDDLLGGLVMANSLRTGLTQVQMDSLLRVSNNFGSVNSITVRQMGREAVFESLVEHGSLSRVMQNGLSVYHLSPKGKSIIAKALSGGVRK